MKNEKPGGHGERSVAVGTIDMAVWDAVAKIAGKPCSACLPSGTSATANPRVFVYAAGGYYYPGKGIEQLRAEMRSYLDRGYTVVKMKIGNSIAEDRPRIEAVLKELDGKAQLAVDANGRLTLEDAIAYAKMLRDYPLFWYEEAGDPLDFALQAALAEFYPGPMATGENLFSHQDARNLLRYGGMRPDRDWLQFDCALSYGLCEYQRTLACLDVAGWSRARCIPHGGHQMSLNIAAGLGPRRQRELSGPVPAIRRLPGQREGRGQPHRHAGAARHRLRGQVRPHQGDARACAVSAAARSALLGHPARCASPLPNQAPDCR